VIGPFSILSFFEEKFVKLVFSFPLSLQSVSIFNHDPSQWEQEENKF
jgi:hypothetical protein